MDRHYYLSLHRGIDQYVSKLQVWGEKNEKLHDMYLSMYVTCTMSAAVRVTMCHMICNAV